MLYLLLRQDSHTVTTNFFATSVAVHVGNWQLCNWRQCWDKAEQTELQHQICQETGCQCAGVKVVGDVWRCCSASVKHNSST